MLRILSNAVLSAACLLVLPGCAGTEEQPAPPDLSGRLHTDVFRVPAGETVWVDGDLTISATTAIVLEGRLIARDAAELGRQDAPSIELVCPLVIDVPGELLGGRGADSRISQGGSGSNLVLRAPMVRILGRVEAGDGGIGGRSLAGGKGGDALVHGYMLGSPEPGHVALRSGAGGKGGAPGGDGGPSGAAIAQVPPEVEDAWPELKPQIDEVLRSLAAADEAVR
jgi:hypothetical protein